VTQSGVRPSVRKAKTRTIGNRLLTATHFGRVQSLTYSNLAGRYKAFHKYAASAPNERTRRFSSSARWTCLRRCRPKGQPTVAIEQIKAIEVDREPHVVAATY
jgi:hypothetical protein